MCRSNYLRALQVAVAAPAGSKDQSVRDQAAATVANVLNAIKDADIVKTLESLTEAERSEGGRGRQMDDTRDARRDAERTEPTTTRARATSNATNVAAVATTVTGDVCLPCQP